MIYTEGLAGDQVLTGGEIAIIMVSRILHSKRVLIKESIISQLLIPYFERVFIIVTKSLSANIC